MKDKESNNDELVEAIQDLTRVLIVINGEFASKSEMVRKLSDLSVPPTRIARLIGMKPKDVTSIISKGKKSSKTAIASDESIA